jgi:hypothetical protein
MDTKNPRQQALAGASKSIGADKKPSTKNHPILQPFDDLARYRAAHLVNRFAMHPETAAALALLAFGGAG